MKKTAHLAEKQRNSRHHNRYKIKPGLIRYNKPYGNR